MTAINIDPVCRRRIQPRYYASNSKLVSAQLQSEMATSINQVARYRSKEYFRSCGDVTSIVTSKVWRFGGHIGPVAGTMIARVLMAPSTQVTSTNNPYVSLALYGTNGNEITSANNRPRGHFGYGYGATPAEVPDEWSIATLAIDVSSLRDTTFRAVIQANEEARPISCTVYEYSALPDTSNNYINQSYAVGAPILDTDRSSLQALATSLYKRGGPSLFAHSSDSDSTAASLYATTQSSYFSIWVPPTALVREDPLTGHRVDLSFCNRKTTTTVPVKIACYAGMSAGSGSVRLVDTAGNVYATFNVSGSAAWQTEQTANLPADARTYIIEHKADGVNTLTTYALTCYAYMA